MLNLWELNHAPLVGVVPMFVRGGGGELKQRSERGRDSVPDQHRGGGSASRDHGIWLLSAHRDAAPGGERRKLPCVSCVVRYS